MPIINQIDKTSVLLSEPAKATVDPIEGIKKIVCTNTGEIIELGGIYRDDKDVPYFVNKIKQLKTGNLALWQIYHMRRKQSYYMLTPMLMNETFTRPKMGIGELVATTFYKHKRFPNNQAIYLLVRNRQEKKYYRIQANMQMHPEFVNFYKVDKYYDLYEYAVPEEWVSDYKLFCKEQFSHMSKAHKERIYHFASMNSETQKILKMRLENDAALRAGLEEQLGVSIPENAELTPGLDEYQTFDPERDALPEKYTPKDWKEGFG